MPVIDMDLLVKALLIAFGFSLFVSVIICLSMKASMKSVHKARNASHYIEDEQIVLHNSSDNYSHTTEEVHPIAQTQNANKNNGI